MKWLEFRILLLCCASFCLAGMVAWGVFGAIPHLEDEHANYFQAKVFAAGRISNPAPPQAQSFFVPFIITMDGRQFSKYPPGFSMLLAFGVLVQQPWLANALAAALGILATYLLGRDLFDRQTGLLAAALGAISPMYIMLSGSLLSHSANLTVLTFFSWAFLRARRSTEEHCYAFAWAAGALAGLAVAIRPWTSAAVLLPFGVFTILDLARRRSQVCPVYARMVATFALVGLLWPLYNLAVTGSPFTNTYRLIWDYDAIGFGPQFGSTGRGHYLKDAVINFNLDFPQFGEVVLGWPAVLGIPLTWLAVGLGLVLAPRNRFEMMLFLPPISLIAAYLAYWSSGAGIYGPRYYSEAMPFLWLLAARGLLKAGQWRIARKLLMIALPLCVAWGVCFSTYPRFLAGRQLDGITRDDARRVDAAGIHRGLIFVKTDSWTDYANLSWLNAANLQTGDNVFAQDLGTATNEAVAQQFPDRVVYNYDRHRPIPLMPGLPGP